MCGSKLSSPRSQLMRGGGCSSPCSTTCTQDCTDHERIETYVGVCSLHFHGILELQNKDRDC